MLRMEFTQEERKALQYERFHHPNPAVQRKMEVLYLKSAGLPHHQIAELTELSPTTIRWYFRQYQEGGIERLKEDRRYRHQSELVAHQTTLEAYFREHPPATVAEAAGKIEELTGIRRKPTQVRKFLRRMGMAPRKVGAIPAKADEEAQETFKKKLEPKLSEAKAGQRAVYFVDAAHFVLAPFLGILWSFARIFIKAPAGRQRFNVLGALNAVTKEVVTVCNESYINAESVCALLDKLSCLSLGVPMTVFLDNARYQRCRLVQAHADSLGIELLFLPPYSPNLNLIERLWKYVKKECLYGKYYETFADFKFAIQHCLEAVNTDHPSKLQSLLALNFQTFKKDQTKAA